MEIWVNTSKILQSRLPMSNQHSYLKKNPDIAFLVYRDFNIDDHLSSQSEFPSTSEDEDVVLPARHSQESIVPVSEDLRSALLILFKSKSGFLSLYKSFKHDNKLIAPYLFAYHSRDYHDLEKFTSQSRALKALMVDYIYRQFGEEYAAADEWFSRGHVSLQYIKYLFKPGDILIKGESEHAQAYVASTWPPFSKYNRAHKNEHSIGTLVSDRFKGSKDDKSVLHGSIIAWSWMFDGVFTKEHTSLQLSLDKNDKVEYKIDDLDVRPSAFVPEQIMDQLKRRGQLFWKCRKRQIVSYHEATLQSSQVVVDERFMIDMSTYRELHPQAPCTRMSRRSLESDALDLDLDLDQPPEENFAVLLPPTIKGYNLRQKKWVNLQADWISDQVNWNDEAFKTLVLDQKTKDLIEALVSNHIHTEKSTDLISGKGNGLILLLHGGLGTGKTLTAESVAEITHKPLYRVTCGDIGIEPEAVGKYLESVLYLGKIWGCVVLLDETDVFLEQRSLEDLKRNALVSVFLRVLEYYDGIFILTNNRVGIFDEAFKSRIQLALHYPGLEAAQRREIWMNFISRLQNLKRVLTSRTLEHIFQGFPRIR